VGLILNSQAKNSAAFLELFEKEKITTTQEKQVFEASNYETIEYSLDFC